MSFRGRFVVATSAVSLLTLGLSFGAVDIAVNHSQERQLDEALIHEALEEAQEAADIGGDQLAISDRPGPSGNDIGPLTKYGAIFGPRGEVRAKTDTFGATPPVRPPVDQSLRDPFDMWHDAEHLRAVLVPVPGHPGTTLMLAAPRTDLDNDKVFAHRAMLIVFAVAVFWSAAITTWVVRRLTREQQAISAVMLRVADGDLTARVGLRSRDREIGRLAESVDHMVERLALLVESQRQFIAHASHELRSPLTALYGQLSLALRRPREPEEYRHAIAEALSASRQLKDLAEDLLGLARLGVDNPRPPLTRVPLADVVAAAIRTVQGEVEQRDVALRVEDDGTSVLGTERDLERLLRNLVENAVRHSPRGGEVTVTVTGQPGGAVVTVTDDGPGVAADDRGRIFEPFFRGARDRAAEEGGAGLGLAIAREIARQHGGDIRLDDAAGRGARFLVTLQAHATEKLQEPGA